jgi:hypothetical protein
MERIAVCLIAVALCACTPKDDPDPAPDGAAPDGSAPDGGPGDGAMPPPDGAVDQACLDVQLLLKHDCEQNCALDWNFNAPEDQPNAIYCTRGDRSACPADCKPACDDRVHVPEVQPCPTCTSSTWDFQICGPRQVDNKYYQPYCQDLGPDPYEECKL